MRRLRAAGCVFAEEEAAALLAAAPSPAVLEELAARRVAGEPLELVLGFADFCGLRIAVEPGVFVPRRRTELLVELAAGRLREVPPHRRAVVVDLCCGSGAVGRAVAGSVGADRIELHATDVDPVAVRCARRTLGPISGRVHQGDLYGALPPDLLGRVDVIVVNAPYVPTAEIPLLPAEAREHEPRPALDGGADGLAVHRRVAAGALPWLAAAGALLLETSAHQARGTAGAMAAGGLRPSVTSAPDRGATVVTGIRM